MESDGFDHTSITWRFGWFTPGSRAAHNTRESQTQEGEGGLHHSTQITRGPRETINGPVRDCHDVESQETTSA
jgi:hypothetical protein